MVMPPCGTFNYVATASQRHDNSSLDWEVRLAEPVTQRGHKLADSRLVGYTPRLHIADAGIVSNPGPHRPAVMRSRITLTASARKEATVSAISFYVDRDLIAHLEPGDEVHISRTACACLGLSILRKGELLTAIGAVTAVDLGKNFKALYPDHLIQQALEIFGNEDPEFNFFESPIEFIHKSHRRILFRGTGRLGEYEVLVRHGFLAGIPGTDVSAAIYQTRRYIPVFVSASAELLENDSVELVPWPGD